jgi:imidazolonepropionase-like amidohydrolase
MMPMQAIVAGTRTAAEALDLTDQVGTLQKGRYADLLVLRGNPLEYIALLQDRANIAAVVKDGKIVSTES